MLFKSSLQLSIGLLCLGHVTAAWAQVPSSGPASENLANTSLEESVSTDIQAENSADRYADLIDPMPLPSPGEPVLPVPRGSLTEAHTSHSPIPPTLAPPTTDQTSQSVISESPSNSPEISDQLGLSSETSSDQPPVSRQAQDLAPISTSPPAPLSQNGPSSASSSTITAQGDKAQPENTIIPARTKNPLKPDSTEENIDRPLIKPEPDKRYKISPQVVPDEHIHPFTTSVSLNGIPVSHLTKWQAGVGYEFGANLTDRPLLDGIVKIGGNIKQSLTSDNVFISEHTANYLQLQTVRDEVTVKITRNDPRSLLGLQQQLSFTGSCPDNVASDNPTAQCNLTPTLVSDLDSIDPNNIQNPDITQPGQFGEVISPETLAAITQPGFQNTGPNGEVIGYDVYYPNIGSSHGNSQSNQSYIKRHTTNDTTQALGIYRVKNIYKANYEKAVLGRTIHGFTGILTERNLAINLAAQSLPQLFPDVNPRLKGSDQKVKVAINPNLYRSANNIRIPKDSFVIYQGGFGAANHASKSGDKPGAIFNSIWFGLSPVSERTLSSETRLQALGPRQLIDSGGGEGGNNSGASFNSLIITPNGTQSFNPANTSDFYTQVYLEFYQTEAQAITTDTIREEFTFHPHISLTGNLTDSKQVFRYFGGVIIEPTPKVYGGIDYTRSFLKDWKLNGSIIGYSNPDRDYFSKAEGSLSKTFNFGPKSSLTAAGSFRYALARPNGAQAVADVALNNPIDNYVAFSLSGRWGPISGGITQFIDLLPPSIPTSTGAHLGIDFNKNVKLSGYIRPQRGLLGYGANLNLKLNSKPNAPSLSFAWDRTDSDFGNDGAGNPITTVEDRFLVLFRVGAPQNPFAPTKTAGIQKQRKGKERAQSPEKATQKPISPQSRGYPSERFSTRPDVLKPAQTESSPTLASFPQSSQSSSKISDELVDQILNLIVQTVNPAHTPALTASIQAQSHLMTTGLGEARRSSKAMPPSRSQGIDRGHRPTTTSLARPVDRKHDPVEEILSLLVDAEAK